MQNELTPNELTNNELIMLDALAYYKQLSDKYIPKEVNGKITYQKLENFINIALNDEDYNTCFNDLISDEKNGMVDILKLVNQNPRLTRLEIVYPVIPDDENTSSVCLVDPITKNVYVIFGGIIQQKTLTIKAKICILGLKMHLEQPKRIILNN